MKLKKATLSDAETIWRMQTDAFAELLARYQDFDRSPGNEPFEKIQQRIAQPYTSLYYIIADGDVIGAIRVVDRKDGSRKRIGPLFVMPKFRNRGYGQQAIIEAEKIHGTDNWELDTILQEPGNCHLYEKMGYHRTGKTEIINDRMTIVFYEK